MIAPPIFSRKFLPQFCLRVSTVCLSFCILPAQASSIDITNLDGKGLDLSDANHKFMDPNDEGMRGYVAIFPNGTHQLDINDSVTLYNPAFVFQHHTEAGVANITIAEGKTLTLNLDPSKWMNFWRPDGYALGDGETASPIWANNATQKLSFTGGKLVINNQNHFDLNKAKASTSYLIATDDGGVIEFNGTNVEIVHAQNGIRVDSTNDSLIKVSGADSFIVHADFGDSQHHAVTTTYGGTIDISTNSLIEIGTGGVNNQDGDNSAVQISWGGNVLLSSEKILLSSLTETVNTNYGLYVSSYELDGTAKLQGLSSGSTLEIESTDVGIYSYGYSSDASAHVNISNFGEASITSGYGIYTVGRDGDAFVNITDVGKLTLTTTDFGINARTGFKDKNGDSSISINVDQLVIETADGYAIKANDVKGQTSSTISLQAKDSLRISSTKQFLFQVAANEVEGSSSKVSINTNKGMGTTILEGDGTAYDKGIVEINLNTPESYWLGSSYDARHDANVSRGYININASQGATWFVRNSEKLPDADGAFKSYISTWNSIDSSNIDLREPDQYQSVDIETLKGSGTTFWVNSDINAGPDGATTDQAVVHKGSGSHKIFVNPTGAEPWQEVQKDYLVWHKEEAGATSLPVGSQQDNGEALSFQLANPNAVVDVGLYFYKLASREAETGGTEWFLERLNKPVDPNPEEPEKPETPSGDLVTSLIGAQPSIYWAQLSDLRERLGEIRYGAQEGLWIRASKLKDTVSGAAHNGFTQKLYGLNLGLDHIVSQNEDAMWLVGGNVKYANANQTTNNFASIGKGDLESYGVNLYATYANYKGFYADFVLSADQYDQEMTTKMTDGIPVSGKYDTQGLGASIEVGKMFSSTQDDEDWGPWYNHWFVEPQAQLAYYWVNGKDYTLSNSMHVSQDNGQSLVGRLGLVVGKKFNYGLNRLKVDKRYSQFYLKGGLKHEFLGEQNITVNGVHFSDQLDETRWYYGAGFDWNLSRQVKAYAEFEKESGDYYEKDYEFTVGLKWQY